MARRYYEDDEEQIRRRYQPAPPPEGYVQSRAALRQIYGTRRINASAPQAKEDMTPSGREAKLRQADPTMSRQQREKEVGRQFNEPFRPKYTMPVDPYDLAVVKPSGVTSASQFPERLPNAVLGFTPGVSAPESLITVGGEVPPAPKPRYVAPLPTDPTGGSNFPGLLAGNAPELPVTPLSLPVTTPSPVAATQLASLLPQTPATGYVPPWRKQQMQPSYMSSILSGASKYLT